MRSSLNTSRLSTVGSSSNEYPYEPMRSSETIFFVTLGPRNRWASAPPPLLTARVSRPATSSCKKEKKLTKLLLPAPFAPIKILSGRSSKSSIARMALKPVNVILSIAWRIIAYPSHRISAGILLRSGAASISDRGGASFRGCWTSLPATRLYYRESPHHNASRTPTPYKTDCEPCREEERSWEARTC